MIHILNKILVVTMLFNASLMIAGNANLIDPTWNQITDQDRAVYAWHLQQKFTPKSRSPRKNELQAQSSAQKSSNATEQKEVKIQIPEQHINLAELLEGKLSSQNSQVSNKQNLQKP